MARKPFLLLGEYFGNMSPAAISKTVARRRVGVATVTPGICARHGFRNGYLRPMLRCVAFKSMPAPDAHTPGGLGIVSVAPTVTFGGQTIYFETLNTAQVGLNPDDGPSPRQPRIAVTNIESLEWEGRLGSGLH